jgi:hypothetical protein
MRSSSVHRVMIPVQPTSLPPMPRVTSRVAVDRALSCAGLVPSPVGCGAVSLAMVALLQLMSVSCSPRVRATR